MARRLETRFVSAPTASSRKSGVAEAQPRAGRYRQPNPRLRSDLVRQLAVSHLTTAAFVSLLAAAACDPPKPDGVPEPAPAASSSVSVAANSSAPATVPPSASSGATLAPTAGPTVSPAEAAKLLASAEACFADATCDVARAEAMFRRADDAGAAGVSCYQFYYGMDVQKDLPRARACFERVVPKRACGGSSPDLDRLFLAAMLIDAQGGPADPKRGTALFSDCFSDGAVKGVVEEAQKRSSLAPDRKPLDFCEDIGGTTASMAECSGLKGARLEAAARRLARELSTKLDAKGRRLAGSAREAWSEFAKKEGQAVADRYRGGSIQGNVWRSHRNMLEEQRNQELAHLFDYKPSPGADPAQAERDLEKAYREAAEGDAEHKKLLAAARKAWTAYRDAEIALYVHVFGEKFDKREVKRDVLTRLTNIYRRELEQMVKSEQ